ncbi:hypothetical protein [Erwinia persicina]|nr:hypothetical protein [Erwinia persicina]
MLYSWQQGYRGSSDARPLSLLAHKPASRVTLSVVVIVVKLAVT